MSCIQPESTLIENKEKSGNNKKHQFSENSRVADALTWCKVVIARAVLLSINSCLFPKCCVFVCVCASVSHHKLCKALPKKVFLILCGYHRFVPRLRNWHRHYSEIQYNVFIGVFFLVFF